MYINITNNQKNKHLNKDKKLNISFFIFKIKQIMN